MDTAITSAISSVIGSIGGLVIDILPIVLRLSGLLIGLGLLWKFIGTFIWHEDGTSNWLGRHWSAWDHISYSPWKGYKRFRSRKWNMEHTE